MASINAINTIGILPQFVELDGFCSLKVYPRIHMFSLDLSLVSGIIKHGSMGLSIDNLPITINVSRSSVDNDSLESNIDLGSIDVVADLDKLRQYINEANYYSIQVNCNQTLKNHTGIGISTQISGGILLCCAKLSGKTLSQYDLFMLGIGHISTLGLNLLFNPGFILETGCRIASDNTGLVINQGLSIHHEKPASTIYRINNFPFYTIIAVPIKLQSMFGEVEKNFWDNVFPDKEESSYKISYEVIDNIIPGIIEEDYDVFINGMKSVTAVGTKPLEEHIQANIVKKMLNRMKKEFGFASVSSMGPAIYCFSKTNPEKQVRELNNKEKNFNYYLLGKGSYCEKARS